MNTHTRKFDNRIARHFSYILCAKYGGKWVVEAGALHYNDAVTIYEALTKDRSSFMPPLEIFNEHGENVSPKCNESEELEF